MTAPDVDTLAGEWCDALDAGQASIAAAGLYLGAAELGGHARRLEEDRAAAVTLLHGLAHEQRRKGMLVGWLATPRHTRAMLGLPEGIDACVFDLEGVLTTSDRLQAEAWADTLDPLLLARAHPAEHFVPFDPWGEYEEHLAARPRLTGIRSFLAGRGLSLPEGTPDDPPGIGSVAALAARKNEAVRKRLTHEGVAAFEAAHAYLEAARTLGIRRAVVSASMNAAAMLDHAGLTSLVEVFVDGVVMEAGGLEGKPAPDTVMEACRRLGIPPARTASFETTAVGVEAARAAGVAFVVGVGTLRARPHVAVRGLETLFMPQT
jgi:HAD superfamily hydrolase (TIGR01509 family)